ncbi:MAG: hypothetical protein ACRDYY_01600 [Acidimicrobiales bacterium]
MTAVVAPPGVHSGLEEVILPRVIYSEWIKSRSLRSTWISLAVALVAAIGLGILFSALRASHLGNGPGSVHAARGNPGELINLDATLISLRGLFLAQLALGVLGVPMITGEYGTGMIRASLTSVPLRWPVLLAKTIVFGAIIFIVATAASLAAFLGDKPPCTPTIWGSRSPRLGRPGVERRDA